MFLVKSSFENTDFANYGPRSFSFPNVELMMNSLSNRTVLVTALSAGVIGVAALMAACGSSNSGGGVTGGDGGTGPTTNPSNPDGGAGVNNSTPGSCANPTIQLAFSPMYSAFIPGSTAQTFQVPAITVDGNTASWSSSDPTKVDLAPDPTSGGVMITMKGTGDVTIFAAEGATCGSSALHITQNSEDDWTTGSARYNDGVGIVFGPPPGFRDGGRPEGGFGGGGSDGGSRLEMDGGTACTNCHGPTATNGIFNDVSHTPEQTGGFSDQELIDIIVNGIIPDGGYFDPAVMRAGCDGGTTLGPSMGQCGLRAYARWQSIHKWSDITPAQQPGIVCYLRSLQPQPQNGVPGFGRPGDGGFVRPDSGGTPPHPQDSGSTTDATTPTDAAGDATGD